MGRQVAFNKLGIDARLLGAGIGAGVGGAGGALAGGEDNRLAAGLAGAAAGGSLGALGGHLRNSSIPSIRTTGSSSAEEAAAIEQAVRDTLTPSQHPSGATLTPSQHPSGDTLSPSLNPHSATLTPSQHPSGDTLVPDVNPFGTTAPPPGATMTPTRRPSGDSEGLSGIPTYQPGDEHLSSLPPFQESVAPPSEEELSAYERLMRYMRGGAEGEG